MSSFGRYEFDYLEGELPASPAFPFKQLRSVVWQARRHLRGMDSDDVHRLAEYVEASIAEQRGEYVREELDSYVAQILEHGSWELGYLPYPEEATEADVRHLLTNWPAEAHDFPRLPSEDDLSELNAFEMALDAKLPAIPPLEELDDPVRAAAVLALMLVAESLNRLDWHRDAPRPLKGDMQFIGVGAAGDVAIEAALALGLAERLQRERTVRAELSKEQQQTLKRQRAEIAKETARQSAARRHEPSRKAMEFVRQEWALHAAGYDQNKSAFARTYVDLVAQQFQNARGEPLKITEKTIREVWLRDIAFTAKQAC